MQHDDRANLVTLAQDNNLAQTPNGAFCFALLEYSQDKVRRVAAEREPEQQTCSNGLVDEMKTHPLFGKEGPTE